MEVQYLAVIVATVVAVAYSAIYYYVLDKQVTALRATKIRKKADTRTTASPNKMVIEIVRTFALVLVMAYVVNWLRLQHVEQALMVALWLWVGFPAVLFAGLVIHERFPTKLAVIHAADWLAKMLIIACIIILWP